MNSFGSTKPALYLENYLSEKPYLRARISSCIHDFSETLNQLNLIQSDRVYFFLMHQLSFVPETNLPDDIVTTVSNVLNTRWKIHYNNRKMMISKPITANENTKNIDNALTALKLCEHDQIDFLHECKKLVFIGSANPMNPTHMRQLRADRVEERLELTRKTIADLQTYLELLQ